MADWVTFVNAKVLLVLNHALAASPPLYDAGLFLTDAGADLALVATAAALWFWPRTAPYIPQARPFTRDESRGRMIAFGVAAVAAYVVARLWAMAADVDRPFVTYLPVRGTDGAFDGLRTFGAFPSDHAALLGALPLVFAYWSPVLGRVWGALAVALMVVRVAVGFHYPADMIAGGLLGAAAAVSAMAAYDRIPVIRAAITRIAAGFARRPDQFVLYPLLALVGLEFAMHFRHLLALIVAAGYWFD